MTISNLIVVPLAFSAGIATIVLAQFAGIVSVSDRRDQPAELPATVSSDAVPIPTPLIPVDSELEERVALLSQQLRDTTLNADKMSAKLKELEDTLTSVSFTNEFLPTDSPSGFAPDAASGANTDSNEAGNRTGRFARFGNADSDVQFDSLVAAGVDPLVAQELKQRNDQWSLQRLELIDQATREGWRRSEEFTDQMQTLREQRPSIRDEIGEQQYDQYLYTSGDNNRVQISSIIDGSAAQLAGIQNGDVILSYADQRVFSMRELQRATSGGSRGESIQVQVLRNGELMSVDLPRGPLGVTLSGSRLEPEFN